MSDTPVRNISMKAGSDWTCSWQYLLSDNSPKDLTGYTAKMQIRTKPGGLLLDDLATSGSGIVITGATGTITASIAGADIADYNTHKAEYDLYIYNSTASSSHCVIQGDVEIEPRITQ